MKFKRFFLFALEFLYRKKEVLVWCFVWFFYSAHTSPILGIHFWPIWHNMLFHLRKKRMMMKRNYDIYCSNMPKNLAALFFQFWFCGPNGIANMRFRYTELKRTTHLILFHSFYQCNTLGCIAHATHDINVFRLYSTLSDDERSSSFWFFSLQFLHVFHRYFFFLSQTLNTMSNLINHFGLITRNERTLIAKFDIALNFKWMRKWRKRYIWQ